MISNTQTNGINMNCPQCGRLDRVTRVRLLHEGGIRESETRGTARRGRTVISADGIVRSGRSQYKSKTRSQTTLSAQLAPPKKPDSAGLVILLIGLIAALICGGYLVTLNSARVQAGQSVLLDPLFAIGLLAGLLAIAGGVMEMARWRGAPGKRERAEYEQAIARWESEYMCQRCGIRFVPGEATMR